MTGQPWSAEDEAILRGCYAHWLNTTLAEIFDRPAKAIGLKARKMGLKKSPELLQEAGRFERGHATWNKGAKGSTGSHPNSRRTQFKRGQMHGAAQHNYVPVGTRKVRDGLLCVKLHDGGRYQAARWMPVHRLVWEAANGPVPAGHIAVFKSGKHTTDEARITADVVEVITRAENMRRNSYHNNYPKEVAQLIQLKGALNRKINNRSKRA